MRCWEHGSFQSRLLVDAMLTRLSQLQFELNGDQQTEQQNIQMEIDPITLGDFTGFYNWFYTTTQLILHINNPSFNQQISGASTLKVNSAKSGSRLLAKKQKQTKTQDPETLHV